MTDREPHERRLAGGQTGPMMTSTFLKRLALFAVLGVSLSACAGLGTTVAEDDPETEVPNVSMGRAIMEGLGAVPSRNAQINYTPRAPLVVPPSTTALVAPEDRNKPVSADWPDDNDLARARQLREVQARDDARGDNDIIGSSELLSVRVPPRPLSNKVGADQDPGAILLPSELGKGWKSKGIDDSGVYDLNGVPRRRALTEPPVAYLQPAPGAPVAIPEEPADPNKGGILRKLKFW